MPSTMYELRVYRGDREVSTASRLRTALDTNYPETVSDLLRRHLLAAADRQGVRRDQAHLFHVNVHPVRGDRADNQPVFTYALPMEV